MVLCPPFPGNDVLTGNYFPNSGQMFPDNGRDRQGNRRGFGRQPGQGELSLTLS